MSTCARCGAEHPVDSVGRYCTNCGAPRDAAPGPGQEPPPVHQAPPPPRFPLYADEPVDPVGPVAPVPVPAPAPGAPGAPGARHRRRTPLVWVGLGVAALLLVVVAVALLTGESVTDPGAPGPAAGPPEHVRALLAAPAAPEGVLDRARAAALDAFDPNHSRDIERAYKADPALAHKTASGRTARAIRALQLEGELRQNAPARADRFVADWRKLDSARETAYRQGNMTGMKRITAQMGGMAKSLERDPQLESLLAGRKQQLGISIGMGRSLGRELATSIGFDWGRGRGLGR